MARPSINSSLDLCERISFTAGSIARFSSPIGKQQFFLRNSEASTLNLRVTTAGAKSFLYEAKLNRQIISRTIDRVNSCTIEQACNEAQEEEEAKTPPLTVGEFLQAYIDERKPHLEALQLRDHLDKAKKVM